MQINMTLFGQMFTFILLVYFTMKYVWPPMMKAMSEREQKIADGLAAAEQGYQSLEIARQQVEHMLKDAKQQVSDLLDQSNKRAEIIISDAKQEAHEEAENILKQGRADVARLIESARAQLKSETGGLAIAIAKRIIGHQMDEAANSHIVDQFLDEIKG